MAHGHNDMRHAHNYQTRAYVQLINCTYTTNLTVLIIGAPQEYRYSVPGFPDDQENCQKKHSRQRACPVSCLAPLTAIGRHLAPVDCNRAPFGYLWASIQPKVPKMEPTGIKMACLICAPEMPDLCVAPPCALGAPNTKRTSPTHKSDMPFGALVAP